MARKGSRLGLRLAGALLLVALMASLVGCGGQVGGPVNAEESSSQRLAVSGASRVQVETFNGTIEVSAGGDGTAQIDVTRRGSGVSQAQAQDALKNVEVRVTQDESGVRVIARKIDQSFVGNSGASVKLTVPAGAALDLKSSNGQVTSTGVIGGVKVRTSNGPVTVASGRGALDLETSNGPIKAEADEASLRASTSNGPVTFKGSFAEGSQSVKTSNGSVTIQLPAQARFSFDASTSNGEVTSEFALSKTSAKSKSALSGTVGESPSASISATSSNGSIAFRKGS